MPGPDHRRRLTSFVVAMALLIATPLAVVAADAFTDVPNSNVHHDDVTWLAEADVTRGCNPPLNDRFCPGDSVTRQQMASFLRRLAENQVVDAASVEGMTAAELQGQSGPQGPPGPAGRQGNANVTIYDAGPHDFSMAPTFFLTMPDVGEAEAALSLWRVDLVYDFVPDIVYHLPGWGGLGGASEYRVFHYWDVGNQFRIEIVRVSGPGEAYESVRITQIAASSVTPLSGTASTSSNIASDLDK